VPVTGCNIFYCVAVIVGLIAYSITLSSEN